MNTNDAWVKCSEQLPEEYDYDLWVYSPTHGVVHGVAYSRSQRGFSDDECQFVIKDATHWMSMEIPEPPEAEECAHRVIVDFAEHTTDKLYTCSKCGVRNMNTKNEVFEYLIDQLRQQVNKKDATSFNVSVQISDLDEVKQVIHNLQQHIAGKDDVMGEIKRWSIDRSIVGRGIYTDEENAVIDAYIGLEHNPYKQQCEDLAHEVQSLKNQLRDASAQIKELYGALDAELKYSRKFREEQSGFRKEDAHGCEHEWQFYGVGFPCMCLKCGLKK